MEIHDTISVPTAPARIFEALSNADILGRVLPGCERVIQLGPAEADGTLHYEARLRLGQPAQAYVAAVALRPVPAGGAVTFTVSAHGQHGVAHGEGELRVAAEGDGASVTYTLTLDEVTLPEAEQAALSNGVAKAWTDAMARRLAMPRATLAPEAPTTVRTQYGEVVTLPRPKNDGKRLLITSVAGLAVGLAVLALVIGLMRRLTAHETPASAE
ncbi:MAG TPA: SRPBCC family protein [Ktedonobacterales bacterium]